MTSFVNAAPSTFELLTSQLDAKMKKKRGKGCGLVHLVHLVKKIGFGGQTATLLAFRLLFGLLFVQAGWGKLSHFDQSLEFFTSLGLGAPSLVLSLVLTGEIVGGLFLIVGFASRFAAGWLSFIMLGAYASAHAAEGFLSLEDFMAQPPFAYLLAMVVVMFFGAGLLSADGLIATWLRKPPKTESK